MKYNKNKEFSEIKKNPSQGKRISAVRRAENMVWTAAGVYDFEPQFLSFWQDGTPDFYTNSIIGYAHKWYFTTAMQTLFSTINDSLHRDLYDGLLWFVLENCTFEREVSAVPLSMKCVIPMQKNSWIRNQAVPDSSGWLRTVLSMHCRPQDVILFSGRIQGLSPQKRKNFSTNLP